MPDKLLKKLSDKGKETIKDIENQIPNSICELQVTQPIAKDIKRKLKPRYSILFVQHLPDYVAYPVSFLRTLIFNHTLQRRISEKEAQMIRDAVKDIPKGTRRRTKVCNVVKNNIH